MTLTLFVLLLDLVFDRLIVRVSGKRCSVFVESSFEHFYP